MEIHDEVNVFFQVLSGITLTKLIGMSVLALTRSELLEVRMIRFAVEEKVMLTGCRFTTSACG